MPGTLWIGEKIPRFGRGTRPLRFVVLRVCCAVGFTAINGFGFRNGIKNGHVIAANSNVLDKCWDFDVHNYFKKKNFIKFTSENSCLKSTL